MKEEGLECRLNPNVSFGGQLRDDVLKFQLDHTVVSDMIVRQDGNLVTILLLNRAGEVIGMPKTIDLDGEEPEPIDAEERAKAERLAKLRSLMAETDRKVIAFVEGEIDEAEFDAIKAQRHAWRLEIARLSGKAE